MIPVIEFMANVVKDLDQALIRHFVGKKPRNDQNPVVTHEHSVWNQEISIDRLCLLPSSSSSPA